MSNTKFDLAKFSAAELQKLAKQAETEANIKTKEEQAKRKARSRVLSGNEVKIGSGPSGTITLVGPRKMPLGFYEREWLDLAICMPDVLDHIAANADTLFTSVKGAEAKAKVMAALPAVRAACAALRGIKV